MLPSTRRLQPYVIGSQVSGSETNVGSWPMPGAPEDEFDATLLTFKTTS